MDAAVVLMIYNRIWNGDRADKQAAWVRTIAHFKAWGNPRQVKTAYLLARILSPKHISIIELPKPNRLIKVLERRSEVFA